jgi:subtilisin family serine protease
VARSRPFEGTDRRDEWLTATVRPGGTYYFVVDGPASATATRLEISSPTHAFQYRERGGSVVAPATARRVLAVGAANATTGDPRPYSGAGPVDGVRPGVDVVADDRQPTPVLDGDFRGTSAASAYAAGVVVLMLDANPNLSPKVVEAVVEATAVEAGPEGVDPVAGHGYLAAGHALERARNVST